MNTNVSKRSALAAAIVVFTMCSGAHAFEIITVRSGQVGGLPGLNGQVDDTVDYYFENSAGVPLATVFDTEFAAADSGPSAIVIDPYFVWLPILPADPLARWINPEIYPFGGGGGNPYSALYSVPFNVTTPGTSNARLRVHVAVDDFLGDQSPTWPGPNSDGLFLNGVVLPGSTNAGSSFQSSYLYNVTVNNGLNHLYLYQRDAGFGLSGMIFSATVTIPEPGTALLTMCPIAIALLGRRRR
jgi:hypothetical protein